MADGWFNTEADEEVLLHRQPSVLVVLEQVLVGVFVAVFLIALAASDLLNNIDVFGIPADYPLVVLAVGAFAPQALSEIRRRATHLIITDERVWMKSRIIGRDVDPIPLSRIRDYNYTQSQVQRLLSIGDVEIMTAGTGDVEVSAENIPQPKDVAGTLNRAIE